MTLGVAGVLGSAWNLEPLTTGDPAHFNGLSIGTEGPEEKN